MDCFFKNIHIKDFAFFIFFIFTNRDLSFCLSISLFFSVFLSLYLCLILSLFLCLSISLLISFYLCIFLSPCFSLSLTRTHNLWVVTLCITRCVVSYNNGEYIVTSPLVQAKLLQTNKLPEPTFVISGARATLSCDIAADREASVRW